MLCDGIIEEKYNSRMKQQSGFSRKILQRTSPANTNFSIEFYHPSNYDARLINRKKCNCFGQELRQKAAAQPYTHPHSFRRHLEGPCCLGVRYNSSQLAPSTSIGFHYITRSFAVTFQKLLFQKCLFLLVI